MAGLSLRRRDVVLRWRRRGGRRGGGSGEEDGAHIADTFSRDEDATDDRELLATVEATSLRSILSRLIEGVVGRAARRIANGGRRTDRAALDARGPKSDSSRGHSTRTSHAYGR